MTRMIYVPIADSFFESSIMREDLGTRFVMLALIRLACRPGANGVVDIDPVVFAASCFMPLADVERALSRLMEPDPQSGCADEEGRRLVPVDPSRPFRNWRLVNWLKYEAIVHRANDAARQREKRAAARMDITDASENVHDRPETSESVQKRPDASANHATNTNTNTNTKRGGRERFAPPTLAEVQAYALEIPGLSAERFFNFHESKGWKVGSQPMKDWKAAARNWRLRDADDGKVSLPKEKPKDDQYLRRLAEVQAEDAETTRIRKAMGLDS